MKWPFVTRKVHELEMDFLRGQLAATLNQVDDAKADRDYWKARAERLVDQALAKRGEINQPVMEQVKPAAADPLSSAVALMAQKEFESVPTVGPAKVS